MINLALVGIGYWASHMADEVMRSKKVNLYKVFTRTVEKREKFARKYNCLTAASYEEILGDPDVDGIILCPLSWKNFFFFLLLALIPTLIGHTLYNYILKYVKAHLVGMTILGEPLGATLWAYLILKEIPVSTFYIGGILIFIGIWIAVWRERASGGVM